MKWVVIDGDFEIKKQQIIFKGDDTPYTDSQGREQVGNKIGLLMNNQRFAGGEITATIEFSEIGDNNACEIVFYFDPMNRWFVSAGIGGQYAYFIRDWRSQWTVHASTGNKSNLSANKKYELKLKCHASHVSLSIDDVDVLSTTLPFSLPLSQTGIHCIDNHDIKILDFKVSAIPGKAFIIMQFSSPFNEIYEEVIKVVCLEFGIEAHRADEIYGPGLIISDVVRKIIDSEFIIAEITPANPNVYYEIGYAHAINKPTIILADSCIEKLPFDVSGFRTIFYENSISGKRKFEESLRKHVSIILERMQIPTKKNLSH